RRLHPARHRPGGARPGAARRRPHHPPGAARGPPPARPRPGADAARGPGAGAPRARLGGRMIRFESVSKRFGDVLAVDDVTLHVPEGELVVLIGPSGCGKTTCLKMINRLVEPSAGRVLVNGRDVAHEDPQALRRGIGYVIQSVGLFPHLSVKQNVQVVPSLLGWPERE